MINSNKPIQNKKTISVALIKSLNKIKLNDILKEIINKISEEILTYPEFSAKNRKLFEKISSRLANEFFAIPELIMRYKSLPKEFDPDEIIVEPPIPPPPPPPPPPPEPDMLKEILKQLQTITGQVQFLTEHSKKVDAFIEEQRAVNAKQEVFNKKTDEKIEGVIKVQKEIIASQKKTDEKVEGVIKTQKEIIASQKKTDEKLKKIIKLNNLKS
ncbi:MAG: hypothetical protein LBC44_03215 [Mycoplasmataceae bacterium]|jgi:hypothetical protein|nr:hypothetical protein [Mycoplasmataceae bacterium]